MNVRVGIDLGGTSAKVGVVSASGKILRELSVPTSGFPNPKVLAMALGEEVRQLARGYTIAGVGVGVAGDIDSHRGIVRVSPNLGWNNVPLAHLLKKAIRRPVVIDNDANAAGWGIYKSQSPKNVKNVIVMTLGTGVGGGIIIDGKLLRGATGSAGEVGHMNIEVDGPLCNCGNRGCLETYVGGPHLVKAARKALERGQKSLLQSIYKRDPDEITPFLLAQMAKKGDSLSKKIWERAGNALGIAIGDLVYILNPEMIFFTGGIAQAGKLILDPLWKTLHQRAFKTPVRAVKIKVAANAPLVGVFGASLL